MKDRLLIDFIYLNDLDQEHSPDSWLYYRITAIDGPADPAGTLSSALQICRVKWPGFEDIAPATDTPGAVGWNTAHPGTIKFVKNAWGADHEKSVVIGLRDWPMEEPRKTLI